ncbi:MAG: hypothetical protein QM802_20535 [Agriterribacter sp.]
MQKKITLRLTPSEVFDEVAVKKYIASAEGVSSTSISGFYILKKSIDARGKQIWFNLTVHAFINEQFHQRSLQHFDFREVHQARRKVIIIGAARQVYLLRFIFWRKAFSPLF